MKQAQEFGLIQKARMAGMTGFITDVLAMGPTVAQGLTLTENFYWDLNDRTRAFYNRSNRNWMRTSFPALSTPATIQVLGTISRR